MARNHECYFELGRSTAVRQRSSGSGVLGGEPSRPAADGIGSGIEFGVGRVDHHHVADRSTDAGAIKRLARSRYLNYQSMMKQCIRERMENELREREGVARQRL